jgi:glutathione S-transferase
MKDLLLYDFPGSICSQMARLAIVEKGLAFTRQTIDIMKTAEQFEPWYIALNPAAVVPTLKDGDVIVTDTVRIVNHINQYPGPDLTHGDAPEVQDWLKRIMALHYGVLLYSAHLDPDRTSPTMIKRAANLRQMASDRPELAAVMAKRIAGNTRLQATLKDPDKVAEEFATSRTLVADMNAALATGPFLCGTAYSLADSFATAALARFKAHGFASWWENGENPNIGPYYERLKSRPSFATAGVVDV